MSQYQIKIDEPCHENWNAMTPHEQGKFCGVCTKEVVDFTSMTDQEVKSYFVNYKGSLCGRFNSTQLEKKDERYFTLPEYTKQFVRAFATVFLLLTASCSSAQTMGEPIMKGDVVCVESPKSINTGVVYGADGAGVSSAKIDFYKNGIFIHSYFTDSQGTYSINLAKGDYDITISKAGYKTYSTVVTASQNGTIGDFELVKSSTDIEPLIIDKPIMGAIKIMGKPKVVPKR